MGRVYATTGIQVQDTSGTVIVDGTGLVSSTQVIGTRNAAVTDAAVTDTSYPGSPMTGGTSTLVLPRSSVVVVLYTAYGAVGSAGDRLSTYVNYSDGGATESIVFDQTYIQAFSVTDMRSHNAGTVDFVLESYLSNGTSEGTVGQGILSVYAIGK